ncbi:beta-ketoacyl synthase N-terminal-like domain-containing protein [Geobacter sp.]|uniref:beta-ketoacyl synthase N-terminal-like domain-containing protein n=1 Tax=Geobacter sp. TaxID=46610 RepID=UPI00260D6084|nr:beta-ketoacyl synthase N-terminal-like domain-containing protein [Geobacter sp.]
MAPSRESASGGELRRGAAGKSTTGERVAVTGFGLVTPMGLTSWRSVSAVIRNRNRFAWHESVLVADAPDGTDLRGATVSRVLDSEAGYGLSGSERSMALLAPALREATAGLSPSTSHAPLAWIINGIPAGEVGAIPCPEDMLSLLSPVEYLPVGREGASGRCIFLDRVAEAVKAIREGRCERALVAAVDSRCFLPVLEGLLAAGRLLSGPNPEGIIPGEAAGAVLLEREDAARKRGAPVYAFISSWGRGVDPSPRAGGRPSQARGLTAAFYKAFEGLPAPGGEIGLVVADLNGERQRALEWALTEGRVFGPSDRERQLWLPAFAVGECGAALGAVQTVVAVAALAKNRAHGERVALFSSDDGGETRVLCLDRGDFTERHALNRWRREQRGNTNDRGRT